ncbi:Copper homeostasis protein CutC [Anaerolineae bacterium]|nr:Copper homeostasis protein CutC [Anaerolineae bacterium]
MFMTRLEIAVENFEDALAAQEGGADSIEIAASLDQNGLTPSWGVVRSIQTALQIETHVMIRPTARDFIYTRAEIDLILAQVRAFAALGVTGVVFGAHTPTGNLDLGLIRQVSQALAEAAPAQGPKPILTVHRALDSCVDPHAALAKLVTFVPRVLSAGHAPNAWEGREDMRRWTSRFGDRICFVASGGLKADQLKSYVSYTKVPVVHLGSAARTEDKIDSAKVRMLRQLIG